jgi:hypothetical protein
MRASHPDERVHDGAVRPGAEELQDLLRRLALQPLLAELLERTAAGQPSQYAIR